MSLDTPIIVSFFFSNGVIRNYMEWFYNSEFTKRRHWQLTAFFHFHLCYCRVVCHANFLNSGVLIAGTV